VVHVLDAVEDDGPAAVPQQRRRRRRRLDHRARGRQVPVQHGDARVLLQRRVAPADDVGVPDLGVRQMLHQRPARHRERIRIQQVAHLAQHGEQSAGPVEILHQVPPGRLQVDQQGHAGADPVEVVE
jgi:hypothetical protein